jgi:hypothetical protein
MLDLHHGLYLLPAINCRLGLERGVGTEFRGFGSKLHPDCVSVEPAPALRGHSAGGARTSVTHDARFFEHRSRNRLVKAKGAP